MKTAKYYQTEIRMIKGYIYGSYYIEANYKGVDIKIHTKDATIWDWLDDDSDRDKHRAAKRVAYNLIRRKYETIKNQ